MRVIYTTTDTGPAQIGSRLIRAFEGGQASHCGAVLSDGRVVDASWPRGVQAQSENKFLRGRKVVADLRIPLPEPEAAEKWLLSQIGKSYDLLDIFSFLLWRDAGKHDLYVCSGLLYRAMRAGGLPPLERDERWGVRHLLIASRALVV
jgi:uncharacterized protein YycO